MFKGVFAVVEERRVFFWEVRIFGGLVLRGIGAGFGCVSYFSCTGLRCTPRKCGPFMSVVCSFGGSSSSVCTSAMSLKSNGLHVLAASC